MDHRATLLRLTDFIGPVFGTEDFCLLLYSLVRSHGPRTIVELGTGLGTSAFWMALAAKRNGFGHVWTVDDLTLFERHSTVLSEISSYLRNEGMATTNIVTGPQYFEEMTKLLEIEQFISFIHERIDLSESGHFDQFPFSGELIDLLFSDFKHGPAEILSILGHFLPRMSPAASIFIDSAPTAWPSFLLLEQLISHLNKGCVPEALQARCSVDLGEVMRNRNIRLVHLTEWKERDQNSAAWLKLEPIDLFPQPRAHMRGL